MRSRATSSIGCKWPAAAAIACCSRRRSSTISIVRSGGVPRLINRVCDRALHLAYERQAENVDREILETALIEIGSATLSPTWDSIIFAEPPSVPATVAAMPPLRPKCAPLPRACRLPRPRGRRASRRGAAPRCRPSRPRPHSRTRTVSRNRSITGWRRIWRRPRGGPRRSRMCLPKRCRWRPQEEVRPAAETTQCRHAPPRTAGRACAQKPTCRGCGANGQSGPRSPLACSSPPW